MANCLAVSRASSTTLCSMTEHLDRERLVKCCQTAQIKEEIDAMPGKGSTSMIGERTRTSGGQKQRLLIARACIVIHVFVP